MKNILFFLLIPFFAISQDVVSDTVYIKKQGNLYYIIQQTEYSDSTITGNKELLGDSLETINTLIRKAEGQSTTLSLYAKPLILKSKSVKRINFYNNLHQQISGRPVYTSTAIRDTAAFFGTWNLTINDQVTPGEIKLNNNNRLVFNPDKTKVYIVTANLLLSTFTNQITFNFDGTKYDLYKFANGKFSTIEGDIKLIKKE